MAKRTASLLPAAEERLLQLGERLRAARLRRRLTAGQVAQRAGMSPMTLRGLEGGGAGVTIGAYVSVMQVLGIDQDLDLMATADPLGRELQDARLQARRTRRPSLPSKSFAPAASGGTSLAADVAREIATLTTRADAPPEDEGFGSPGHEDAP